MFHPPCDAGTLRYGTLIWHMQNCHFSEPYQSGGHTSLAEEAE